MILPKGGALRINGKVDLVKYAGFVVITIVGAMTAQKNGVLGDELTTGDAARAGLLASGLIIAQEKIRAAFVAVGKAVCKAPKDSFLVLYVGDWIKEKGVATKNAFRTVAHGLNTGVSKRAERTRKIAKKLRNTREPKL